MVDATTPSVADEKERALQNYRRKLNEHRDIDARLKELRKKVC